MTSTTRITSTVSRQAKGTFFALLAFSALLLVTSLARGRTGSALFTAAMMVLFLLGALSFRRAATVLTSAGVSHKRGVFVEGATWSEITDITVVGGRGSRVRIAAGENSFTLRVPVGSDPEFAAKVEQIRAAWLAAKDAPAVPPAPVRAG